MKTKMMALTVVSVVLILVGSVPVLAQQNGDTDKKVELVYADLSRLIASVGELREELCLKQTSPQLCRIEFGTLTLIVTKIVTNIGVTLANARMAAVTGNKARYEEAMSEVKDGVDRFNRKFEELVKKYTD